MGAGKWISGLLGWVAFGPIGALLGWWFGRAIDNAVERAYQLNDEQTTRSRSTYSATEQRNSFLVSLMGKKVGEIAEAQVPSGTLRLKIESIMIG